MSSLLAPPLLDTPERTERAQIFHTVALHTVTAGTLLVSLSIAVNPTSVLRGLFTITVLNLIIWPLIPLNRYGRTRLASWCLVSGLAATITFLAPTAGGILSPAMITGISVTMMAGTLLGDAVAIAFGIWFVALGGALVFLGDSGLLPAASVVHTDTSRWVLLALSVWVVVGVQRLNTASVRRSLARAGAELAERRRAEEELRGTTLRLQLALDAGQIAIWDHDLQRGTLIGDDRLFALWGIPPTADRHIAPTTWTDRVHHDDREALTAALDRLARAGGSLRHDFRIVRPGGEVRHIFGAALAIPDASRRPVRMVGMNADITERRRTEQERERLLRDLSERVKELRLLHETTTLLQQEHPSTRALFEALVARIPDAWQHAGDCVARLRYAGVTVTSAGWRETPWRQARAFRTPYGEGTIEVGYLTEHATEYGDPFLAEERALLDSLGEMLETHLEHQHAERERTSLEQQVRQSQKMQALGTLAGGIAHDFNNIIAAIGGNAELALADLPAGHVAGASVEEIQRATARAADLVRRILLFSRKQDTLRRPLALPGVVEEAVSLLRATLPPQVVLRTSYATDLPLVAADTTQMHQIVMNLGTNAGHALGEDGGTITFSVARVELDGGPLCEMPDLRPGTHVRLEVVDTGCGMSEEVLVRIFDPFFTTKGPDKGTGLGLSVVDGIARAHDGAVAVASTPGVGTTFRLYFPAAGHTGQAAAAAPEEILRGRGERIMYVDDEESLVFVMTRILQRAGYDCTGFSDVHQALQAFRARPGEIDAVITDFAMPGMNGVELARALRDIRADIPLAMTSGHGAHDADVLAAAGIHTIIPKPATIPQLSRAMRELLDGPVRRSA